MNQRVPNGSDIQMDGVQVAPRLAQAQILYLKTQLDIDVRHGIRYHH